MGALDFAFNASPEVLDYLGRFESMAYLGAAILFILALAGLSKQKTAQRGNKFGIAGMAFALVATVILVVGKDDRGAVLTLVLIAAALLVGALFGIHKARSVQMTEMPQPVAMLHSFVGAAAVLVGFESFFTEPGIAGVNGFHMGEVGLAVFIGAVTFTGSIISSDRLSSSSWSAATCMLWGCIVTACTS